ncbi:MAG: MFS transporter [Candidatus Thorarchaeota archaeon]|nr:MAG: MFS transporter [Candidatus Thorarchaeota archaeon]
MESTPESDWASLKSVYNSAFLCSLGFFMVSFLIPIVAYSSMGATATQVALVFSMLTLGTALFSPVAGKIAKTGRRRESILGGAVVRATAYTGMTVSIWLSDINLLILNSLVWGVGSALYRVGSDAEISERVYRDSRAEAFGHREAAVARGNVIGAFLGFVIYFTFGLGQVFIFYAIMNIIGGFIVIRERPPLEFRPSSPSLPGIRTVIRLGVLALVAAAALDTFISALLAPFVEIFILDQYPYLTVEVLALVYLPGGILSGVLGAPLGRYADRTNKVVIVSAAVLVGSISTLTLAFVPSLFPVAEYGLLAIAILFSIGTVTGMMAYTVMSSVLGTVYEGRASEGFGLFEAAMGFSRFSGPIVGGLLWDFVNPIAPFLMVGAVGLFLIPIYAFGMHNYQRAIEA